MEASGGYRHCIVLWRSISPPPLSLSYTHTRARPPAGRGYWDAKPEQLERLKQLYMDVEDKIEGVDQ